MHQIIFITTSESTSFISEVIRSLSKIDSFTTITLNLDLENSKSIHDLLTDDKDYFAIVSFIASDEWEDKYAGQLEQISAYVRKQEAESYEVNIFNLIDSRVNYNKIWPIFLRYKVFTINFHDAVDLDLMPFENEIKEVYKRKERDAKEAERYYEQVSNTAIDYLDERIGEINADKKEFKLFTIISFCTAAVVVAFGIGLLVKFAYEFEGNSAYESNNLVIIIWGLKGLGALILVLTLAKYLFLLGKYFMNESVKYSDREHAITFGKLYVQLKEDKITPDEIQNVFSDWNLYNKSAFLNADHKDFDPQIPEKIVDGFKELNDHLKEFRKSKKNSF
ncbi:MAG: hypothetical protein ACPGJS_02035 [Flammeovirgaceae bacterium]